jgi:hypothetical protein
MRHPLARCAALVAAACIGHAAAAPAAPVNETSIIGRWKVVEAAPAPWTKPEERAGLTVSGKHLLNLVVTFNPTSVQSKFKLFSCKRRVIYEPVELQVDALFQGNLPEPNPGAVAQRMGFPRGDVQSVDVKCVNARFTFHFLNADTVLINLNRVIYTFKRQ